MHHNRNATFPDKIRRTAPKPSRNVRRETVRACMLPVDPLPLFAWQASRPIALWPGTARAPYAVAKFAQRFRLSPELTQTVIELANIGGRGQ